MSAQSQPRGSWLGHFFHVIVGKGVLHVYIMTGRDGKSCKISFSSGDPFAAGQSLMNTMFHCVLTCNCVFTRGQRHIEVLSNFDDLLTTLDPYRLTTALTLIKHAIKQLSGGFTRCQQAWWEGFLECHCKTKVRKRVSDVCVCVCVCVPQISLRIRITLTWDLQHGCCVVQRCATSHLFGLQWYH